MLNSYDYVEQHSHKQFRKFFGRYHTFVMLTAVILSYMFFAILAYYG